MALRTAHLPILRLVAVSACLIAATTTLAQPDRNELNLAFATWIDDTIWPLAQSSGVSPATFESAFDGVALDLDLPELLIPGVGAEPAIDQAEFRSPGRYFDEAGLATLARIGREELDNWSSTLASISATYDVPAEILLAIWARESAFGRAAIPHYAIEALATQAFIGRRADKFLAELIAALQILEAGDVAPNEMRSSWAGGLGHPQFLPSTFQRYAVDFDGDGHRNIWTSVPDTLASIANFLRQHGWDGSLGWAEEIVLQAAVPCTLEGPHQGMTVAAWRRVGLDSDGRPREIRYLLMPAGRLGPAFLVTDNFYVLKDYNESDVYALFVGHLADRIAGRAATPSWAWSPIDTLTHGQIRDMQLHLEGLGYDVGGADGLVGFRTRISVGAVQPMLGLPQTCFPDRALIQALG